VNTTDIKLENIIDSIPDFFSIHDLDQKIVTANKTLADFLGVTKKEIVGKFCYEVFHDTKTPWIGCAHLRCIDSKKPVTEIIDDPNIGIPLMICCSPYYGQNGELEGTVHIAKNISDQHLVAQENEKLISELNKALADIKKLSGFLPICASCKKIRDDKGYWNEVEAYIKKHSTIEFSHSICPGCVAKLYPEFQGK